MSESILDACAFAAWAAAFIWLARFMVDYREKGQPFLRRYWHGLAMLAVMALFVAGLRMRPAASDVADWSASSNTEESIERTDTMLKGQTAVILFAGAVAYTLQWRRKRRTAIPF